MQRVPEAAIHQLQEGELRRRQNARLLPRKGEHRHQGGRREGVAARLGQAR